MECYTFGQMLMTIRMVQKAETPDGRIVMRTSAGLIWTNGLLNGKTVEIKDYLFSDLWQIYEDEESMKEGVRREKYEEREREMLENQYEELRLASRKR